MSENVPLSAHMGNLIFVYHFALLHFLNSHYLSRLAIPADTDFAEGTTADNFQRFEVFNCDFGAAKQMLVAKGYLRHAVELGLLVLQLLLYVFFLGLSELHFIHLRKKLVPGLFLLSLLGLLLGILRFYVGLDALGPLTS